MSSRKKKPRITKAIAALVRERVDHGFADALGATFKKEFNLELSTTWNLFVGIAGGLVSKRADEQDFTPTQKDFCHRFEQGYLAAMEAIR